MTTKAVAVITILAILCYAGAFTLSKANGEIKTLKAANEELTTKVADLTQRTQDLKDAVDWDDGMDAIHAGTIGYTGDERRFFLNRHYTGYLEKFMPITVTVEETPYGEWVLKEKVTKIKTTSELSQKQKSWSFPLPPMRGHGPVFLYVASKNGYHATHFSLAQQFGDSREHLQFMPMRP